MARSVLRTCVGCRRVREQEVLVRITADPAGHVIMNARRAATGSGRGAYLCPSLTCLEQAWRRKVFSRALRRELQGLDEAGMRARFEAELRSRGVIGP
jgi:predicted RNA-binding protein YlxR (DUF448 family)